MGDCKCACLSVNLRLLHACLSVSLPARVHASVKVAMKNRKRAKKGGSAVSQCWLSRELMGVPGKLVGRPEPSALQASFIGSATSGLKHHKVRNNGHLYAWGSRAHLWKTCIMQQALPLQTQLAGRHSHVALKPKGIIFFIFHSLRRTC